MDLVPALAVMLGANVGTTLEATERHLEQMDARRAELIQTSALQLDITRELKRIEARIAATAYGVLERDAPGA